MRQRKFIPGLIQFAVFLLLEAAALFLLTRNAQLQRIWVAKAGHGVMGAVWGSTQRIRDYFLLRSTNEALARENFALQKEVLTLQEALRGFRADTTTHPVARDPRFRYTGAEVVKISNNKQHNYLILNKGFEDGIQEKAGIITRDGVIGIIDAVSAHNSYAFSFQNKDISISARLGGEGATGILVWDGLSSRGAVLKEIPLQYKYEKGDTVFTSGHSLVFPPDIPLGIAGESKVVNGATNEVAVSLFQDFKAVRYVTVVYNTSFEEVEEFQP